MVGELYGRITVAGYPHRHKAYIDFLNLGRCSVNGGCPTLFIGNTKKYQLAAVTRSDLGGYGVFAKYYR